MYIVSIASNEKFNVKINLTFIIILILIINEELINESQIDEIQRIVMIITSEQLSIIKLYNKRSILISIMLVIYLFITIIAVTKIVKHYKGPLRSKN